LAQLTEALSKEFLRPFGLPCLESRSARTSAQAGDAAEALGGVVMVKIQVPAGGRGKAGGIRRAASAAAAAGLYDQVTAIEFNGLLSTEVLIEPVFDTATELYLAVALDPPTAGPCLLFAAGGGIEVEEGDAVVRIPLRADGSVPAAALRRAAFAAGLEREPAERLLSLAGRLARAFSALDASLIEINPLAVGVEGSLVALDAKLIVDDNALFRQPEVEAALAGMGGRRQEDLVRDESRLEFVRLGGSVGLISGGAGMTMAVMDMIDELGASPACFLDCSANPTPEGYGKALDLLRSDPEVKVILISIFGGLTQIDRVARTLAGLIAERRLAKPIILRLMGTNAAGADAILEEAGLQNHHRLEDAVALAVASLRRLSP